MGIMTSFKVIQNIIKLQKEFSRKMDRYFVEPKTACG